jgi:hypothetical protein
MKPAIFTYFYSQRMDKVRSFEIVGYADNKNVYSLDSNVEVSSKKHNSE